MLPESVPEVSMGPIDREATPFSMVRYLAASQAKKRQKRPWFRNETCSQATEAWRLT